MTLQKPNSDQASEGSLAGGIKDALNKWLMGIDDMLPARVVSYDDATNRAVIQPIVMVGGTDGSKISRAQIANIPVYRFGGGGFFMRFPLKSGDLGWMKANDRDISLIMQSLGGEEWPNTKRLHSFSDAMFFPDTFKQWVINGEDVDAAVWQSMDGEARISLAVDRIKLAIGGVSVEVSAAGVAIISPPGTLTHNGKNVGDTHSHNGSPTAPPGPVTPTGMPV
ncbi:hypothetical protein KS461_10120 [Pseudomonas chlororaphis]|uniref:Gp138 family membrane-puncturing spike protein n=1 Tax=Pseudomonas chlororaphis TaxID=587753 RepID=UPI00215B4520|nr:Gp138 family membrane-puncturing spike protein [Pseudomonas chlororaphis]UVE47617.1 hypothetical protein KS461_10120 [Pseudomonas chlororaphis]